PSALITALQQATSAITDYLAEQPTGLEPALQEAYFKAMQFCRIAELFGDHSLFDCSLVPSPRQSAGRRSVLCIRNVLPAPFLAPRLQQTRAPALSAGTVSPHRCYADTLGLPGTSVWVEPQSPAHREQLQVNLARHISTRYEHRA